MSFNDTILALSSAPPNAQAPRALLRLSGPSAWQAAQALLPALPLATGFHQNLPLPLLHPALPIAAALLFQAPRSFTGEDIAELHLPASPALLAAATDALLRHPTLRNATPGEFSARAFLNGKIDLTEAEGIAATIHATDQRERQAAASLKNGHLHKKIDALTNEIANLLALVEAGIDFSDEEGVSFIDADKVEDTLEQLGEHFDDLLASSLRIDRLHAPPTVAFIGEPNVGKSSLLNALTGLDRSIVSPAPGTTRDILAATLQTPHGDVRLLDLPGNEIPSDELRTKMMDARALALFDADLVIRVVDHTSNPASLDGWTQVPGEMISIQNKADLLPPGTLEEGWWLPGTGKPWGSVSAKTGHNIAKLREVIARLTARHEPVGGHAIALNQRHRAIFQQTKTTLWTAAGYARDPDTFRRHPELLASHLRHALDLLGQITGAISPDQILGRIFSTFCIGK